MQKRLLGLLLVLSMLFSLVPVWGVAETSESSLPTVTFDFTGYAVDATVVEADVSVSTPGVEIGLYGGEKMMVFCEDNEGIPSSAIVSETATFEKEKTYWAYLVVTSDVYNLQQFTEENFEVTGGCEDILISSYEGGNLYLYIRMNRFEKPQPVAVYAEGYALGNQGVDVWAAVDAEDMDLTVGSEIPYALLKNSGSNSPGGVVNEEYIQPETVYWLGVMMTNQTGDYSDYTAYDFSLNIPYTSIYISRSVEYMVVYFRLEALEYQNVPSLDFTLDGYFGGNLMTNSSVLLEQKGFQIFENYAINYGFHYHDEENDGIGDFIPQAQASSLTFTEGQTLWLWVNVMPLYNTVFAPAPEVSLNIPYSECLMQAAEEGSLDIAFKLEPIQAMGSVEMELSGYALGEEITQVSAAVSYGNVELFPGGYAESVFVYGDANNEPGGFFTAGQFEKGTTYWVGMEIKAKEGYSLENASTGIFNLKEINATQILGVYDATSCIYHLFFQLPAIEVYYNVTFTAEGDVVDGGIVKEGEMVTQPADPTLEGKVFLGWYTEGGEEYDFNTPITADLVLVAKFEDQKPELQPVELIELVGAPAKYEVGKTAQNFPFDLLISGKASIATFSGEKMQTWASSDSDTFATSVMDPPLEAATQFVSDKYYYVAVRLQADEGYCITEDTVVTINGQKATVEILNNEGEPLVWAAIGYDKETGYIIQPAVIEYAVDVILNGYTLGGKVADASVAETSDSLDIVTFADDKNFYILADKAGVPDYDSEVTEFEADTQYWLMIGLEKAGGGDLFFEDLLISNITYNGAPVSFVFDDDVLMAIFKLDPLSETTVTYGDVDGNGTVDAADALKALQHAVKLITLEGEDYTAANVNGDDKVDAADALLILQHTVKLIDKFPVEQ